MMDSMPLPLFYEWMDYYERNSFGDELGNYWHSLMCSFLYNPHRGKGKPAREPKDFLPTLKKHKKKKTSKELGEMFRVYTQAHNASLKSKKSKR